MCPKKNQLEPTETKAAFVLDMTQKLPENFLWNTLPPNKMSGNKANLQFQGKTEDDRWWESRSGTTEENEWADHTMIFSIGN